MFSIGGGELLLIGIIALIFIGPKQLPEVARVVGRMLNEFKRASGELTKGLYEMRDHTQTYIREQRQDLARTAELEDLAKSVNQTKEEFVDKLKKEIEELDDEGRPPKPG